MSTLPGETSPPKSGCSLRVPPLLMKAMKLDEDGSTGAPEMSRFHQLVAGKSGAAPRSGAPWTGTVAGHCARLVAAESRPAASESTMRAESMEDPCVEPSGRSPPEPVRLSVIQCQCHNSSNPRCGQS